ncbi:HEAT repeat domain-containing protein [Haliangium sp.]|uniref:HEAT repeat domain-containing protein n=1 Tax=Haliangium sp. TaxID=2663208 RepID=UPI003D0BF74A
MTRLPDLPRTRLAVLSAVIIASLSAAALGVHAGLSRRAPPPPPSPSEPAQATPPAPAPDLAPAIEPAAEKARARSLLGDYCDAVEPKHRRDTVAALIDVRDRELAQCALARLDDEPDDEVRALIAELIGRLGDSDGGAWLGEHYRSAAPPVRVAYDEALCRLDDTRACRRLGESAHDRDLTVAFLAAQRVAAMSAPGDRRVLRWLRGLLLREHELPPLAGLDLLGHLSSLGDRAARERLRALLTNAAPGVALGAAETLAGIGDDAGREILIDTFNDGRADARERVRAVVALVALGDYAGRQYLEDTLTGADDPALRRHSLRGLGEIGAWDSLRAILARYRDDDHRVRIAAAAAVLLVLGLDPQVLAQESVDWLRTMMASARWQDRRDAGLALAALAPAAAVPLLAQGLADPEPAVRRAFANSAATLTSPDAAPVIIAALAVETDPTVREHEVVALARIANPAAKEVLEAVAERRDRPGVLALGALLAIGEGGALARLSELYRGVKAALRVAVMEAAMLARDVAVLDLLRQGLSDRAAAVRAKAAEGLVQYGHDRERAAEVLQRAAATPALAASALPALLALGVTPPAQVAPATLLSDPAPERRRVAVRAAAELPWPRARGLLQRALHDRAAEVRRDAVGVAGGFIPGHGRAVEPLLKQVVRDSDGATRAMAKARLARLLPPPPGPNRDQLGAGEANADDAAAAALAAMESAAEQAEQAHARFAESTQAVASLAAEVSERAARRARSERDVSAVVALGQRLGEAQAAALAAYGHVVEADSRLLAAARALPPDAPTSTDALADADRRARAARSSLAEARRQAQEGNDAVTTYVARETAHCDIYVAGAETAVQAGRLGAARKDLQRAADACGRGPRRPPQLDFVWGLYYDERAQDTANARPRRRHLERALRHYQRFLDAGKGYRVERARERIAAITDELAAGTGE